MIQRIQVDINSISIKSPYISASIIIEEPSYELKLPYKQKTSPQKNNSYNLSWLKMFNINELKVNKASIKITQNNQQLMSLAKVNSVASLKNEQFKIVAKSNIDNFPQAKLKAKIDITRYEKSHSIYFVLKKLNLKKMNPYLIKKIPIDLTRGGLSVYFKLINNKGFLKLFINDSKIIENNQYFKNDNHFWNELISAFSAWLLENSNSKDVAAKIPFKIEKSGVDIEKLKASISSLVNVFDSMKEGFEKKQSFEFKSLN